METFYNPLSRSELQIKSDLYSIYASWKLYDLAGVSGNTWEKYAYLAWKISPDLACNLYHM
jgi:hypothetical protein